MASEAELRRNYEMTEADLKAILDRIQAARATPLIMLQCGMPPSIQEVANDAWAELGSRMGFKPMSVEPTARGARFFTAIPAPQGGDGGR